jgi:hypothetical protein
VLLKMQCGRTGLFRRLQHNPEIWCNSYGLLVFAAMSTAGVSAEAATAVMRGRP